MCSAETKNTSSKVKPKEEKLLPVISPVAQEGEEGAKSGLQAIVIGERERLLRFLKVRGAGDEADDLFHDLWHRVANTAHAPIADPLSYLFRSAENLMRDRRRSSVSRERRQHEWHDLSLGEVTEQPGERAIIAKQRLAEALAVLEGLGARVPVVFRRYKLDGVGQAEIAKELGVSLSSIEKDLQKAYRALSMLKAKFDAE